MLQNGLRYRSSADRRTVCDLLRGVYPAIGDTLMRDSGIHVMGHPAASLCAAPADGVTRSYWAMCVGVAHGESASGEVRDLNSNGAPLARRGAVRGRARRVRKRCIARPPSLVRRRVVGVGAVRSTWSETGCRLAEIKP
jgi:hypothetical protein